MAQPRHHLRHDPARRRTGARLLAATCPRSCSWPGSSTRWAWTSSRPASRSPRRPTPRRCAQIARRGAAAGHRRAGALPARRTSSAPARRSSRPHARRIHTFLATSDLHLERKLRITREQCLDAAVDAVTQRAAASPTTWSFRPRTRRAATCDFLCRVVEAVIDAGATTINLPDTVGYATPDEIREFFDDHPAAACPTPTRRSSARTATTTSGWPSPTGSRRCRAARGRSSARSTASASAPATRRSKRS